MLSIKRITRDTRLIVVALVALGVVAAGAFFFMPRESKYAHEIEACAATHTREVARIDCWYSVLREVFDKDGTEAAFNVFVDIYETYPDFTNTGCHRHAHRIGDMAYYYDYLSHQDLRKVAFPKNASTCGYGFYHGFFEHLVQGVPEQEFVTQTCNYLIDSIFPNAPAIGQTCYHGSGHGLVLSRVEALRDPADWTFENFTQQPLAFCDTLPEANAEEKADCRQGVFNVLVDWMDDGEYNLTYDTEHPFAMCENQQEHHRYDCYYEMAQKLDRVTNFDLRKMATIAREASTAPLQQLIMNVGGAALIQHDPKGSKENLLAICMEFEKDLRNGCIKGVLGGIIEHGITGEYSGAVTFCEANILGEAEREVCYESLYQKLTRFETDEAIDDMCSEQHLALRFCENVDAFRE